MIKALIFEFIFYLTAFSGLFLIDSLSLKFCLSISLGIIVTRLFILGHDLAHQMYFKNKTLNDFLAQICLLPSLTPLSLWRMGHNLVHHRYTNLRTHDFIWAPLSKEEFDSKNLVSKLVYLGYRSFFGFFFYTLIEVWVKRFWFPFKEFSLEKRRKEFLKDIFKVGSFFLVSLSLMLILKSPVDFLLAVIIPFFIFIFFFGLATYLHHTHPDIKWFDNKEEWAQQACYNYTVHWSINSFVNKISFYIMEHISHHKSTSVKAQDLLKNESILLSEHKDLIVEKFSWKRVLEIVAHCKIYDYNNKKWVSSKELDLFQDFCLFRIY